MAEPKQKKKLIGEGPRLTNDCIADGFLVGVSSRGAPPGVSLVGQTNFRCMNHGNPAKLADMWLPVDGYHRINVKSKNLLFTKYARENTNSGVCILNFHSQGEAKNEISR